MTMHMNDTMLPDLMKKDGIDNKTTLGEETAMTEVERDHTFAPAMVGGDI